MKHLFFGHLLFVSLLLCSFSSYSQEERSSGESPQDSMQVVVPTSEYADLAMLVPPPSFEESPSFNGYVSYQTGSGIIMTLITNVVYVRLAEGMDDAFYEKNSLTYISDAPIETDAGYKGRMFKLTYTMDETDFIRYMVYISDLENTLWLNITYPTMMEDLVEDEILKSIQSVNLKPE